jgi:hypothetical protein
VQREKKTNKRRKKDIETKIERKKMERLIEAYKERKTNREREKKMERNIRKKKEME